MPGPLISDRYEADPFPVPRSYDERPSPSSSSRPAYPPLDWLERLTLRSKRASSPMSSRSSSPPVSPTAPPPPHPHPHPHLSSPSLPSFLIPLHSLTSHIAHSRALLAQSLAEAAEHFPDASGATRTQPRLPNQRASLRLMAGARVDEVRVSGELLAVGAGYGVEIWSAREAVAGWCVVGRHGFAADQCTTLCWSTSGRYLWVGTVHGALYEFDTAPFFSHPSFPSHFPPIAYREDAHPSGAPIVHISRTAKDEMYTLDASGRLVVWLPDREKGAQVSLHSHSKVMQLPGGFSWVEVLGREGLVWMTWDAYERAGGGHKAVLLRVFDVSGTRAVLRAERAWGTGDPGWSGAMLGKVTSGCVVPSHPHFVFLGHDSGHVSVWFADGSKLVGDVRVSLAKVTAMISPSRFLWVGYSDGLIDVLDIATEDHRPGDWTVVKRFKAHEGPVVSLAVDHKSLWTATALRVVSTGSDMKAKFWDGLLREDWLVRRMASQVDFYCTFEPLKVGIFTWNVDGQNPDLLAASPKPVNREMLQGFLEELDGPDMIVFNFQELIDLSDLNLAARTVLFATKEHDVTGRYRHWRRLLQQTVTQTLGPEYAFVKDEKLVGLYTAIFARQAVKSQIRDLATHHLRNGFDENYGNKGSIMIRMVLNDSSFCFINSHLTSGKKNPAERERDLMAILDGEGQFPLPQEETHRAYVGGGDGTAVSDCEIVFFAGDLNFRLNLPRPDVLHTLDTVSLPAAISSLLPHDELTHLRATNPSFRLRSFSEAPILFPPTWKYDHGSEKYDTSPKQRTPSWCDRVLWRSQREKSVVPISYGALGADISDHRPVAALFAVAVKTVDPSLAERAFRKATHAWAAEAEDLVETARAYYPPPQV
ncbi:hypothetical protein JCM8097_006040 [Rhodosporidiobolus ruineniae]